MEPTPKNVRAMVELIQARSGMYQEEIAGLIGLTVGALKKNMTLGTSHRAMSRSTFELLLLHADRHPRYRLVPRKRVAGATKRT